MTSSLGTDARDAGAPRVGGSTRVVALLGDPVSHSLSPRIQNAAFRASGVDGVYVPMRCGADDLEGLLLGIARGGGAGNVTIPHKQRAADLVDDPSQAVRVTGACNTFWLDGDRVRGDNTDVAGFRGSARALLGRGLSGSRVLLLGAGGAARAVVAALAQEEVAQIVIRNRTAERARRLATEIAPALAQAEDGVSRGPFDLVVNATSLGLHGDDPFPLEPAELAGAKAFMDLVYRPTETPLVRRAREMGIPAADGGEMLVLQGAEAFRLWWGEAAPVDAMREALEMARADTSARSGTVV